MELLKLHIGSRSRFAGWKTLDIQPGPEVDYVGNCKDLSQFADGSIDEIYASHVLEHLSYQGEVQVALKEWFRVLRSGGHVLISVPDMEILCKLFLHLARDDKSRFALMQGMFGGQIDPHDFHKVGFWQNYLGSELTKAGFREIIRVKDLGRFDDTSHLKAGGVPISLNMKAVKPS